MSEFLALLAIESQRTAAQYIEVAGSKGNTWRKVEPVQSVRERGSRGNQKPCTENRGIGRTKLQELPTTADAAFFFWV